MSNKELVKYALVNIGQQEFGILVEDIVDIISTQKIFPIPLAAREILGSINLRGQIVTALDIKILLGISRSTDIKIKEKWIVVKHENELFGFMVDVVKEVSFFTKEDLLKNPDNMNELWQNLSSGVLLRVHTSEELVLIMNIKKLLEMLIYNNRANN